MKKFILSVLSLAIIGFVAPANAQSGVNAETKFKKHINKMVESVEKAENATEKREILNTSLDDLIGAIEKVETMKAVPEKDKEGLAMFKEDLKNKKDELNGINGFSPVANNNLNNFAQFVQQDIEQADKITIGVTTLLLIIIILLLL